MCIRRLQSRTRTKHRCCAHPHSQEEASWVSTGTLPIRDQLLLNNFTDGLYQPFNAGISNKLLHSRQVLASKKPQSVCCQQVASTKILVLIILSFRTYIIKLERIYIGGAFQNQLLYDRTVKMCMCLPQMLPLQSKRKVMFQLDLRYFARFPRFILKERKRHTNLRSYYSRILRSYLLTHFKHHLCTVMMLFLCVFNALVSSVNTYL